MSEKIDYLLPDEKYEPKQPDWEKIKYYKDIEPTGCELKAHERDVLTPEPVILSPPPPRKTVTKDDVTDFPEQRIVPLPESRPYEEGKYRPPSMPVFAGVFPTNTYLYRGKIYEWCGCGHAQTHPWCDGQCKWIVTRLRPIRFNVSESGYYKMCNCKLSANAPFCSGTHKSLLKATHATHRGFFGLWGTGVFFSTFFYWWFTFYH